MRATFLQCFGFLGQHWTGSSPLFVTYEILTSQHPLKAFLYKLLFALGGVLAQTRYKPIKYVQHVTLTNGWLTVFFSNIEHFARRPRDKTATPIILFINIEIKRIEMFTIPKNLHRYLITETIISRTATLCFTLRTF